MTARRSAPPVRRQRGQGTIEFQVIAAFVLIPLLMFVLQIGLLVIAKNTLNVAALGVARAGAASGINDAAMKDALALGLAPLNASQAKADTGIGMGDITGGNYPAVMGAALARTKLLDMRFARITVLNPTTESFADFSVKKAGGQEVIPVTRVFDNKEIGKASGQTRADALLLKVEVRYCHTLAIPIINAMIRETLNSPLSGASLEDRICYAVNRVPLVSQAVVRITVPPIRTALIGKAPSK